MCPAVVDNFRTDPKSNITERMLTVTETDYQ